MKPGITLGDEAKAGIARSDSPPVLFLPALGERVGDSSRGRCERIRGTGKCGMAEVEADGRREWLRARRLKLDKPSEPGKRDVGVGYLPDDVRVAFGHGNQRGGYNSTLGDPRE